MQKRLLIVESPTKARTISKYLGGDYEVMATVGHFRDLPSNKMGVNLKDFTVDYVLDPKKRDVVSQMGKLSGGKKEIYLASDPDREGEAIAWHVQWLLTEGQKKKVDSKIISRVSFHEITKEAIEEALKKATQIDMNLVNAQQGRRVLDRVVGYSLSPVLWKKVRRGLSAGRVQSVAVRLICEREMEIEAFKREKYFRIAAGFRKDEKFEAELQKIEGKNFVESSKIKLFDGEYSYSKSLFGTKEQSDVFVGGLDSEFVVAKVQGREMNKTPAPAYTTSKLQQAGARRFGWSGKQTMTLAQRLYEQGLITYHRTDSVNLSDKAVGDFRKFIEKEYGANYLAVKPRVYRNTSKNAQEAHEAIRPTRVEVVEPENLDSKELKLYQMIWKRAVATQAAHARLESNSVELMNKGAMFKASGLRVVFDGFYRISGEKHEDQVLPELKIGEKLKALKINITETETSPMPRYSDASLVASLEKQGIGRPSTYAPIITTIIARQYVEKDEGRFKPTSLGMATNEFLTKNFPKILSLPFTAEMETGLDKVALGKMDWRKMMKDFWKTFKIDLKNVEVNADRVKVQVESTGEKCPTCKEGDLVIRVGKFGKFVSCSRFPDCKYTAPLRENAGFLCPLCGNEGVVKRTKSGKKFFGCSNYPACKWAGWKKP
ncbi:MAG: topoisomerase protein [Candidatus Shapirobacteria bacterium GW2011_GWE1_38_10]|uniref:DNA topoisomerase 1 n=1 Tax=Candidatus Shapirobacteria bacterium GW2011_GWE1_38_10 TaxID=1618488 RepID=A0A0G0IE27_9BACT|nr:MAG: topoisomerase protein [Candidatus Shapirobacteria bacterium GW2011_GWE1_38_10]